MMVNDKSLMILTKIQTSSTGVNRVAIVLFRTLSEDYDYLHSLFHTL